MRVVLCATVVVALLAFTAVLAGPVSSGALLLLLPAWPAGSAHASPEPHEPLHKGGVDLATGLYVRENDDLVVSGTPPIVLRRTYTSRYRVSREFGIGSTHPGEEMLRGDGERFGWVMLALTGGTRINFKRISAGTSVLNAVYEHDGTVTGWQGARVGWTGFNWALRKQDGSLAIYRACSPKGGDYCSIVQSRDSSGHTTYYRRDAAGTLLRMDDGADRWIALEYDGEKRIARAHDSTGRHVRYEYDSRDRLAAVTASDGVVRRYTYTDLDELATIEEPGTSIQNQYENGRCVRQVNRFPDADPLIFDFSYDVENGRITRTETKRSDGSWERYTWSPELYPMTEIKGLDRFELVALSYQRDPATQAVTALTLTCPDRRGLPLKHSSLVRAGEEERVKANLLRTHCYWNTMRPR